MDEWPSLCGTPETSGKCRDEENHIHMSWLGQAGRQARRHSTSLRAPIHKHGNLGTADLSCNTNSAKGTMCEYLCGDLTYSTQQPPLLCRNGGLFFDPDDHLYSASSLIMCVSVFRVLPAHMETLVALDLLEWRYGVSIFFYVSFLSELEYPGQTIMIFFYFVRF